MEDRLIEIRKKYVQATAQLASVKASAEKFFLNSKLLLSGYENKVRRLEAIVVKILREQGKTDKEILDFAGREEHKGLFQLHITDDENDLFKAKL